MAGYENAAARQPQLYAQLMDIFEANRVAKINQEQAKRQQQQLEMQQARQQQQLEMEKAQQQQQMERQKSADIRANDLEVAQREAAQGRPDIMQLGFPAEYQAQQEAAADLVQKRQQQGVDFQAKTQDTERERLVNGLRFARANPGAYPKIKAQFPDLPDHYPTSAEFDALIGGGGGITINTGEGKQLPTNVLTSLGDVDTARAAVKGLHESFTELVPSRGIVNQTVSRGAQYVPNTDVSIYEDKAKLVTQIFGKFFEDGVLRETDYARYLSMRPRPGDSAETAKAKIDGILNMLDTVETNRRGQLKGGKYQVPESGRRGADAGQSVSPDLFGPPVTDEEKQFLLNYRRQKAAGGTK